MSQPLLNRRRAGGMLLLICAAFALLMPAPVAAQQPSPADDAGRQARIEQLFSESQGYRNERHYDLAAAALRDIAVLAGEGTAAADTETLARVLRERENLAALIEKDADLNLLALKEYAKGFPDAKGDEAWERIALSEKLGATSTNPDEHCADIVNDIKAMQGHIQSLGAFALTEKERRERRLRLRAAFDKLESQVSVVCSTSDSNAIQAAMETIDQKLKTLEKAAEEDSGWLELRQGDKKGLTTEEGMSIGELKERIRKQESRIAGILTDLARFRGMEEKFARLSREAGLKLDEMTVISGRVIALSSAYQLLGSAGGFDPAIALAWLHDAQAICDDARRLQEKLKKLAKPIGNSGIGRVEQAVRKAADILADRKALLEYYEKKVVTLGQDAEKSADEFAKASSLRNKARICVRTVSLRTPASSPPAAPAATPPAAGGQPGSVAPLPQPPAPPQPASTPAPQAQKPSNPPAVSTSPALPEVYGGIRIQGGSTRILVGQIVTFVATDMGNRPYRHVLWNSLNEELLVIDDRGIARGIAPGALTIQAKLDDDPSVRAYLEVVVVPAGTQNVGIPQQQTKGQGTGAPTAPSSSPGSSGQAGTGGFGVKGPTRVSAAPPGGKTDANQGTAAAGDAISSDEDSDADSVSLMSESAGGGFKDRGGAQVQSENAPPADGSSSFPSPPEVKPLSVRGEGQPAAWHIFAAGSRLGWAGGRSRYTDGYGDQQIMDDLVMAGEHAMWANRESYPPSPAWPDWSDKKLRFRSWALQLTRSRGQLVREQLALTITSEAAQMADQLRGRRSAPAERNVNCEFYYMELGFHLAFGQVCLQVAVNAEENRRPAVVARARQDGLDHLRQASQALAEYERYATASGGCADLRDVRNEIEALITLGSLAAQVRMSGHAWETASERIRTLSAAQPAAPPPASSRAPLSQGSPSLPSTAPAASGGSGGTLVMNDRIEGDWRRFTGELIRFTRRGNAFHGEVIEGGGDWGLKPGRDSFDLVRTAPFTYTGTYTGYHQGSPLDPRSVYASPRTFLVLGNMMPGWGRFAEFLRGSGPARPRPRITPPTNKPIWAIGCRREKSGRLCTIEVGDYFSRSETALKRLQDAGYPEVVYGPASWEEMWEWVQRNIAPLNK